MIPSITTITGKGLPRLIKEIPVILTSTNAATYTNTTATDSTLNNEEMKLVQVNMRIRAKKNNTGFAGTICYAKVVSKNENIITVDEWIGGTPTNENTFTIDGYIADLPRTERIVETFSPDVIVQDLANLTKRVKTFGYSYSCELNYETFFSPDYSAPLKNIISQEFSGSENLILIPRKDKAGNQFNVYIDGDITQILHPSKLGWSGIKFSFIGKKNLATPTAFLTGGYGFDFGKNFGTQL